MYDNRLILSVYNLGETVYYINGSKITETKIIKVVATSEYKHDSMTESVDYVVKSGGWKKTSELYKTKLDAGRGLLEINGLDITLGDLD